MKKAVSVIFVGIIIISLCGCSTGNTSSKEGIRIGLVYYDKTDTFIGELLEIFRAELINENDNQPISISLRDADGSQRTQNRQVEELIAEGCDVLLVNLVDRANPSQVIDSATKSNVPIIFFNREPVAEDLLQWDRLYYIGADAQQSGVLQAEQAAEYTVEHPEIDKNGDGKIQYVILEGEPGHQDAIIRTEAVLETLGEKGVELEKISHAIANWSRPQAKNRMGQLIKEYGENIELVLSNNDDMAIGASEAYEGTDISADRRPVFFGIDGTDVGLAAVKDGTLAATVYNDKFGQAKVMAKLSIAIARGDSLGDINFSMGKAIYLPYFKVNAENINHYIKK